jgi:hypothetical protein
MIILNPQKSRDTSLHRVADVIHIEFVAVCPAVQVADRWHLLKNMDEEKLELLLPLIAQAERGQFL